MKKALLISIVCLLITGCEKIKFNSSIIEDDNNIKGQTSSLEIDKSVSSMSTESSIIEETDTNYDEIIHFNESSDNWIKETEKDKFVVTVIGASYCPHCTNFKPVAEAISRKYNTELYYYYIDEIENKEKITDHYDSNYNNSVPHIFITKKGEVLGNRTGEMSAEEYTEFLRLNLVIK